MRNGLAGVHHQVMKHFEFLGREMNRAAGFAHAVLHRIEFQLPMANRRAAIGILGISSAHRGTQTRGQLAQLKGFGNVIVGAEIQGIDLGLFLVCLLYTSRCV